MGNPSSMSWAGVSISGQYISNLSAIGRNLAYTSGLSGSASFNAYTNSGAGATPTEIMLAPGQTFSAVCGPYNIVVIPEAG